MNAKKQKELARLEANNQLQMEVFIKNTRTLIWKLNQLFDYMLAEVQPTASSAKRLAGKKVKK